MVTTEAPGAEANAAQGRRSFVDTWTEVVADAGGLLRAEAALARLETRENLRGFAHDTARIGVGALLLSTAIVMLSVAGVIALSYWLGMLPALLLVSAICTLLGYWLYRTGASGLSARRILPDRALARMSRDLERLSRQGSQLATQNADLPDEVVHEKP